MWDSVCVVYITIWLNFCLLVIQSDWQADLLDVGLFAPAADVAVCSDLLYFNLQSVKHLIHHGLYRLPGECS